MKTKCSFLFLFFLVTILSCFSCKKDDVDPKLSVSTNTVSFAVEGGTSEITVSSSEHWTVNNAAPAWMQVSLSSGGKGDFTIQLTAGPNPIASLRSTVLVVNSNNGQSRRITVSQTAAEPQIFPSYNTSPKPPDAAGMNSNAVELAAKIKLGWNLGNTLEAMNNTTTGSETVWGNPLTTKAHIDLVKANGFNAVRLPCSWNGYLANAATAEIKLSWLNRVKEVVQYCVDNDMYVLLNIHWDGGWLDEHIKNVTDQNKKVTKAKQKAYWEQIATHLRDFDEHLMFASANEPPVEDALQMATLNSYHQTFIDAVRSTGGRNTHRVLVVQGPSTDIEKTETLMNTLPSDPIANRLMVEVHYYGPFQFCGLTSDATWGKMFYYWGNDFDSATDPEHNTTWGEEDYVVTTFQKMKTKFVDKGIPVLLGEYGAIRRTDALTGDNLALHLASRNHWCKYITQQARAHGMLPFYWDEGSISNHGFGIFDRKKLEVFDQEVLDALIEGANP